MNEFHIKHETYQNCYTNGYSQIKIFVFLIVAKASALLRL